MRDTISSRSVHHGLRHSISIFVLSFAVLVLTPPAAISAPVEYPNSGPIADLPLPVKRPETDAIKPAPLDKWSEADIIEARAQCAPILSAANAEFEIVPAMRKGPCGTPAPIKLSALGTATRVKISPPATVNCRLVGALNQWLEEKVQPLAREKFASPVVELRNVASYACRNRYGKPNRKLSEHALANALDIASLKFANGKRVNLNDHWGGTEREYAIRVARAKAEAKARAEALEKAKAKAKAKAKLIEQAKADAAKMKAPLAQAAGGEKSSDTKTAPVPTATLVKSASATLTVSAEINLPQRPVLDDRARFLRELHKGACGIFGTVLGPEANRAHEDHFHFDLAPRRRSAYCE